jgi:putative nucleotidyltransferase with HDIG domain
VVRRVTYFVEHLRDLIASNRNLPTLPEVVLQLHAVLQDDMASEPQVASIIERDPALAGRLLKVANSAFYFRGTDSITSVTAAVARLGLSQVHAMCIAVSVVRAFSGKGLDHRRFWRHSVAAAMTADALARHTRGVDPQHAYIAGLLHDVGLLVLDQFFPDRFAELVRVVREEGTPIWRAEEARLGLDHGEIGGLLLGRWSLSGTVADAVAHHHHPEQAPASAAAASCILQASEGLTVEAECGLSDEGPPEPVTLTGVCDLGAETLDAVRPQLASIADASVALLSHL